MLKFLPLLLFLFSCALGPGNFQSRHTTDLGSRNIRRVAVLPPASTAVEGSAKAPDPSAPSTEGKGGKKEPATTLSDLVYITVSALPRWQVVSDREVREVIAMLPDWFLLHLSTMDTALCRALNAPARPVEQALSPRVLNLEVQTEEK
mgnify:CR=1 FL=1